jgi:O-antigen ligase
MTAVGHRSVPCIQDRFWTVQSAGLVLTGFSTFFPPFFHWQEYVFLLFMSAAIFMSGVQKNSPWVRTPLDLPLGCFLLWVLCTVPFATDVAYSFAEWRKFGTQALIFYWGLLVLQRSNRERLPGEILAAIAAGGAVLAAYGFGDFIASGGTWRDRYVRARALGSDYNWLSTYMVVVIPMAAAWMRVLTAGWMRGGAVLTLVLSGLAQVFSYTRAGWVAHAAQGVAWAAIRGGHTGRMAVAGAVAVVGLLLVLASLAGFQKDTIDAKTIGTRLFVWNLGLAEILAHPITGIGYGNDSFVKKYPQFSPQAQAHLPERVQVIPAMHSAFVMVAIGSGIPALLCFVWMFVRLLRLLLRPLRDTSSNGSRALLGGAIGLALLGFGVRNLFDYMFMGSLAHLFWLLAAVGVTISLPVRGR